MKGILTMLLTLVIMIIGLAMIIGGPGAVRFLFAPFLSGLRMVVRVVFVALIVLFVVAALLSGKRSATNQGGASAAPSSENGFEDITNQEGERHR